MKSPNELKESAASVGWWLDPANVQARKELAERRPELGQWLQMVEARAAAELERREEQEEAKMKA